MKPTPVDIVLHSLADNLRELPDDRLRDLANAITTHCVDPRVVADQWTDGAGVGQHAAWLLRRLDPNDSGLRPAWAKVSAETRAMEVAVARRLADAGLALLVTQDDDDRTAGEALLEASHLVVGLPRAQEAQYSGLANEARLVVDHITTWSRTSDHPYVGTRLSVAVVDLTKRIDALRASDAEARKGADALSAKCADWRAWALSMTKLDPLRLLSDSDVRLAVDNILGGGSAERYIPPAERLTWVGHFNEGRAGAQIMFDGRTLFVQGKMADDLADALCRWRSVLDARTRERDAFEHDLKKARDEIDAIKGDAIAAEVADLRNTVRRLADEQRAANTAAENWQAIAVHASAELEAALDCARRGVVWVPKRVAVTDLRATPPTQPKFKVGDRVRFARREGKNTTEDSAPPPLGWEGKIIWVDDSNIPYQVVGKPWSLDQGLTNHWFPAEAIDLVTPA